MPPPLTAPTAGWCWRSPATKPRAVSGASTLWLGEPCTARTGARRVALSSFECNLRLGGMTVMHCHPLDPHLLGQWRGFDETCKRAVLSALAYAAWDHAAAKLKPDPRPRKDAALMPAADLIGDLARALDPTLIARGYRDRGLDGWQAARSTTPAPSPPPPVAGRQVGKSNRRRRRVLLNSRDLLRPHNCGDGLARSMRQSVELFLHSSWRCIAALPQPPRRQHMKPSSMSRTRHRLSGDLPARQRRHRARPRLRSI